MDICFANIKLRPLPAKRDGETSSAMFDAAHDFGVH